MENKELEWIAEVIEKLQVPQTYNEGERLIKILKKVAPGLIKTLDNAITDQFKEEDNPKHCFFCAYDDLVEVITQEQEKEQQKE